MNELIRSLYTGNIAKTRFALFFLPILLLQIIGWAIARALLPAGYLLDINAISRQGNLVQNPIGAWFFIISTAITGFLLIFYFIYLYRRLLPTMKFLCRLFVFFGIIGGLGLSLVGMFPEQGGDVVQTVHNIGNIMAFGGLGIAAFFSLVIMFRRLIKKQPWPNFWQFGVVFALCLHYVLVLPFTQTHSVTQWNGFSIIFVYVCGMFLISPDVPEISARINQ